MVFYDPIQHPSLTTPTSKHACDFNRVSVLVDELARVMNHLELRIPESDIGGAHFFYKSSFF